MVQTKRKILMLVLTISIIVGASIPASAHSYKQSEFADMPQNWSTAALTSAIQNGILSGYNENGKKLIKPNAHITRAEVAAIMNNAFNATLMADMTGVTDVAPGRWYTEHMAKAVKINALAKATKMRPDDKITREEAFTVIAKMFHIPLSEGDYSSFTRFSDHNQVSAYAKEYVNALVNRIYISGSGNKLNPKGLITRAEFAAVMDNVSRQYITTKGVVTGSDIIQDRGHIVVNTSGVTLKDIHISGNLVISGGITEGVVTLENVNVHGYLFIDSGGSSTVRITGNSTVWEMHENAVDGNARISKDESATVKLIRAYKSLVLDGTFDHVNLDAPGTRLTVPAGSSLSRVDAKAPRSVIQGEGEVFRAVIRAHDCQVNTNNTRVYLGDHENIFIYGTTAGYEEVPFLDIVTDPTTSSQNNHFAATLSLSNGTSPLIVTAGESYIEKLNGSIADSIQETDVQTVMTLNKGSINHKKVKLAFEPVNDCDMSNLQIIGTNDITVGVGETPMEGYWNLYTVSHYDWFKNLSFSLVKNPSISKGLIITAKEPGTYKFKVQVLNKNDRNKVIAESAVCTVIAK